MDGEQTNDLGSVSDISIKFDVDSGNSVRRINSITKALQKLTPELEKLSKADLSFGGKGSSRRSGGTSSSGGKQRTTDLNNLGIFGTVGKVYFFLNYTKRLTRTLAGIVKLGIDYSETLNLWQTSMRKNVTEARRFISELSKAYGISEAVLMNYQGTFNNMLSAMGNLSSDTAYSLSKSLTQMALDFSSLYNTSIEEAMVKFQAVLAGQVRPIRTASGYDITENTIFALYQQMGGTKTQRQLNQTEKQLLRIYAVFTQMQRVGATGDLYKTLTNNANMFRMMKEQVVEIGTWLGNSLAFMIEQKGILVDLNAGLIVLKEIVKSIAIDVVGYREQNFIQGIAMDSENAESSIDNLQKKLTGFDKFQVLKATYSAGDQDISKVITNALAGYESFYKTVNNPAYEQAQKWIKALGGTLTEVTDAETGATTQFYSFGEQLKEVAKVITTLTETLFILIDIKIVSWIGKVIKSVTGLTSAFSALGAVGLFVVIYEIRDLIKNWDELNTAQKILKIVVIQLGVAFFALSKYATIAKVSMAQLNATTSGMIGIIGGASIALLDIIGVISMLSSKSWNTMTTMEKFTTVLYGVAAAATVAGIALSFVPGLGSLSKILTFAGLGLSVGAGVIRSHAFGGGYNSADLFYANENGKTELIASNNSGGGAVMNMEQLQSAITRGMVIAYGMMPDNEDRPINVYVDGDRLFTTSRNVARRNGYDFARKG